MVRMEWLESLGSFVEMAWASLRRDHASYWSATILLDASVEVLLAFLVLVCTVLNFFTSSFIRVCGFHIPCSCCVHFRKESSVIEVEASENLSFLPASKLIGVPVEREVRFTGFDFSNEYSRDGERKSINSSPVHASREAVPCESPLEVLDERDGAGSEDASLLRCEEVNKDFYDRTQDDVDIEQYLKIQVQELLRALQSERDAMATLYSELEEERNSSATAASEALAMISRVQEEKAAIQMESCQFQRMVMEKAMYDQEAFEVLKEIVAKQEEERIDLEEEVRLYKQRLEEVLTEERDYAERTGRDYVPIHPLEGTSTEGSSTSSKPERAELLVSERISPNGRISKEEGITPDGRVVKEERTTPNGRPSKEERIIPNGRLEDAEFLDRLSKTKSQLLTALLEEGFPEPASAFVEEPAGFAKEIHKAIAKIPARAESLPILNHGHYKAALLGLKTGREIGLPIPPAVAKKQTEKALRKDAVKSAPELVSVSRKPSPPSTIVKKIDRARVAKDAGKVADEAVFFNRERTPPTIAEEMTEKARAVKNGEPVFVSREIGLSIPPRKQTEKASVAKDAGRFTDKPLIISREVSLPNLSLTAAKKQSEEALTKDDGKAAAEPEFVSLKRRWSSRGSQEVSVEVLAKAQEDRRMEEKRLSVLEYVRNLEEQLQQHAGRPAAQLARARSVDGREEDVRLKSPGQFDSSSVSTMLESSGGSVEQDESVQRRLFADGYSADKELSMISFHGGGDDRVYAHQYSNITELSDGKISNDEGGFYGGKSEESTDEALFVHDVYEADRYHMKQAIDSLRRESRETKLLQEIALQLRELRGMEQKGWHLSDFLPQILRFQVGVAKAGSSICKKRRCNSTPRGSSCRPGTGLSRASTRLVLGLSLDVGNHTPCGLVS